MKRLAVFALIAALAAIGLTYVGRDLATRPRPVEAPKALPEASLTLHIGREGLEPARAEVPKDHRVSLTIANQSGHEVTLRLAGYEQQLEIAPIADGTSWRGTFTSDRPGDDFAWLMDGEPAGRLSVIGSHLTEGRR